VLVRADASLRASASQIAGNVIGQNSAWVCLQFASSLGGDFFVKGGALHTTTGFDIGVTVGGHARVMDNAGLTFIDAANVVGNVDVSNNTGTIEVEFNTIGGNVTLATTSCRRCTRVDRPSLHPGAAASRPPSFSRLG